MHVHMSMCGACIHIPQFAHKVAEQQRSHQDPAGKCDRASSVTIFSRGQLSFFN